MLELTDVRVYYGNIRALAGVTFRVDEGELVAIIGSNGAGKSTTLRTISGLLRPRPADGQNVGQGGGMVYGQGPHQIDTGRVLGGGMPWLGGAAAAHGSSVCQPAQGGRPRLFTAILHQLCAPALCHGPTEPVPCKQPGAWPWQRTKA